MRNGGAHLILNFRYISVQSCLSEGIRAHIGEKNHDKSVTNSGKSWGTNIGLFPVSLLDPWSGKNFNRHWERSVSPLPHRCRLSDRNFETFKKYTIGGIGGNEKRLFKINEKLDLFSKYFLIILIKFLYNFSLVFIIRVITNFRFGF